MKQNIKINCLHSLIDRIANIYNHAEQDFWNNNRKEVSFYHAEIFQKLLSKWTAKYGIAQTKDLLDIYISCIQPYKLKKVITKELEQKYNEFNDLMRQHQPIPTDLALQITKLSNLLSMRGKYYYRNEKDEYDYSGSDRYWRAEVMGAKWIVTLYDSYVQLLKTLDDKDLKTKRWTIPVLDLDQEKE